MRWALYGNSQQYLYVIFQDSFIFYYKYKVVHIKLPTIQLPRVIIENPMSYFNQVPNYFYLTELVSCIDSLL